MNNALKAGLLSALVFPGAGQVVLKQYKRGIVFMVTVIGAMVGVVIVVVEQALRFLDKIQSEGGIPDINAISSAATQATLSSGSPTIKFLLLFIVITWGFSAIDAYRIGKKKDLEEE